MKKKSIEEENQKSEKTRILSDLKKQYEDGSISSILDVEDLKIIKQINSEKEMLMKEKQAFNIEKELFENELQKIQEIKPDENVIEDGNVKKEKKFTDVIDCLSCGHPITSQNYLLHNEQCFIKVSFKCF